MKRAQNFILDLLINGTVIYVLVLLISHAFYSLTPTSLYFRYTSVEPVSEPIKITDEYILMQSELEVSVEGNLYWNDVLRCLDSYGSLSYFSQYDTSAEVVYRGDKKVSQWYYRGEKPNYPTYCSMYSTITRKLPFGIEKQQTIESRLFQLI